LIKDRIISHIVAASENNIIGKDGGMPWRLPDDFRFFKNTTWAMPVIMGRKTFESMPESLPGRINIVITSDPKWNRKGVSVSHNLEEALDCAMDADTREIFIIGGGRIFKDTMEIADKIYLTRVHAEIDGDTQYPVIDPSKWEKVSEAEHPSDAKHDYAFTFETWERKR